MLQALGPAPGCDAAPLEHRKARVLAEAGERALWQCVVSGEAPRSTPRLAAMLGYSTRSLQLAFARHVGVPVTRYARLVRLHCAREALLRGGPGNVSAVAMRYGIGHFGRFSIEYRALYGEAPSVTLKRARSAAAGGACRADDDWSSAA